MNRIKTNGWDMAAILCIWLLLYFFNINLSIWLLIISGLFAYFLANLIRTIKWIRKGR
ncbi:hypothetical protein [Cytobacillus sp. FSL K6-0265]|uniref:hypothetical protein n=1 Tax=Cytobacillus sp. FSL K6-0265 TaxID=2921448 RepID=UPI0030FCAF27